jgi:hypothetical protein
MGHDAAVEDSAAPLLDRDRLAAPWFESVRDVAALLPLSSRWPTVAELDAALSPAAGVRFVAGEKIRPRRRRDRPIDGDELYEIRIASRREVPTRAHSAHDLLNALAWACFPAAKWALAEQLASAQRARLASHPWRLPGARTRRHDRLALLDEGGVLLAAREPSPPGGDALASALADGRARALVFGHALLEHALAGCLDVWGAALWLPVAPIARESTAALRARLDEALAEAVAGGAILDEPSPWPRFPLTALAAAAP